MGSGSTQRADAARRQRIHPRMGPGLQDAGDARPVCEAVDHGRLPGGRDSRSAVSRAILRSREVAARIPEPGVRQHAARTTRSGARGWCTVLRRSDPGDRRPRARYSEPAAADYIAATLIKRRDKVVRTWLTGRQPARRAATGRRRRADVRKRRRVGWRGVHGVTLCPVVVALRQRHGHLHGIRGGDSQRRAGNRAGCCSQRRSVRHRGRPNDACGLPRVGDAGYVYVPAGGKRVANGGDRAGGSTPRTALIPD